MQEVYIAMCYSHEHHNNIGMAEQFMNALFGEYPTFPNAMINAQGIGPLPPNVMPSFAPIGFKEPDGDINNPDQTKLLQGGLKNFVYSYGANPDRIETQTQNNIPNKVQRIIPKLFIPGAQSDGSSYQDPLLEHSVTDGDLVFSLKMNKDMTGNGSKYVIYPLGYSDRAVKLINLATVNYILWGLQVGSLMPGNKMWLTFFRQLCKTDYEQLLERLEEAHQRQENHNHTEEDEDGITTQEMIWNFIQTYIGPFGVQHGFDMQGGQHEGSKTRVVTNAVDYVSSFAVEGKILKVNNLWKACDVYEDDDLVLALRCMRPQSTPLMFNLSSSNRSTRTERTPIPVAWWYLSPETLEFKSIIDTPHIHIGRSQKMVTAYAKPNFGNDMPSWNARSAIQGTPLQMTLEPCFMSSDAMCFKYDMGIRPRKKKAVAVAEQQHHTQKRRDEADGRLPAPFTATHAFVHPKSAAGNKRPDSFHKEDEAPTLTTATTTTTTTTEAAPATTADNFIAALEKVSNNTTSNPKKKKVQTTSLTSD